MIKIEDRSKLTYLCEPTYTKEFNLIPCVFSILVIFSKLIKLSQAKVSKAKKSSSNPTRCESSTRLKLVEN